MFSSDGSRVGVNVGRVLEVMQNSGSERVRNLATSLEICRTCDDCCPGIKACVKLRQASDR